MDVVLACVIVIFLFLSFYAINKENNSIGVEYSEKDFNGKREWYGGGEFFSVDKFYEFYDKESEENHLFGRAYLVNGNKVCGRYFNPDWREIIPDFVTHIVWFKDSGNNT